MNYLFKVKNLVIACCLIIFTPSLGAEIESEDNTFHLHVVNEKFGNNNPQLRERVDLFLEEVWEEAVSNGISDIQEINQIAYEKLNKNSASVVAKLLFKNGLRIANTTYIPTSNYNETLSSIARSRGDSVHDWNGQEHPLIMVFSNYALDKSGLSNLQPGDDSHQDKLFYFEVSSEEIDGKSAQDIFYEWTSSFANSKIIGTEKEKYSQGRGWRMAVIVNDTIVSAPFLIAPLKDSGAISGQFTRREMQKLVVDPDES